MTRKKLPRLAQALLDLDRRVRATSRLAARLERKCASCPHHDLETEVIGFRFRQDEDEPFERGAKRPLFIANGKPRPRKRKR